MTNRTPLPWGRPSAYKPEYCEQLIEHMAEGLSYESFAGAVRVSRQTIYDWEKKHPSFLDAKKTGIELNLLFWEREGKKGLWSTETTDADGTRSSIKLNTTLWIFNMKNRHKWADRREIDAKVTDGSESEREKIRKLTQEELEQRVKESLAIESTK